MEAIERIEVVHGPASALYGGNALFAVVNVVTTSAQDLPGIRPLVETGSFGRKRGQLSIGHQFDYNIFDLHNPDPAGPEHTQVINGQTVQLDQIPQDGFTFRVQLQYAFGTH